MKLQAAVIFTSLHLVFHEAFFIKNLKPAINESLKASGE